MGVCPKIGGFKSGLTDEECDILYNFGFNLGIAFQLIDDTLDFYNNRDITGKEAGNDFLEGKITLPYLHLMDISQDSEKKRFADYARKPDLENWKIIQREVLKSGSIDYCVNIADEYSSKAINFLEYFPSSIYKDILIELTEFLVRREY